MGEIEGIDRVGKIEGEIKMKAEGKTQREDPKRKTQGGEDLRRRE